MAVDMLNDGSRQVAALGDSAGAQLCVSVGHVNAFHTIASFSTLTSAAQPMVAAPAAGISLYIQDIHVYSDTACTFTFGQDTASLTSKSILHLGSAGGDKDRHFDPPLMLTAAKNFGLTLSHTNATVYVSGFFK